MKFKIKTLTPAEAADMLLKNYDNRPIRMSHVRALARAITAGDWLLTHQAIAVDTENRILDGQHRLLACVTAKKPIEVVIATECDPKSFMALDIGAKRSISDILGGDRRTVETITKIARIAASNQTVAPAHVDRYVRFFGIAAEKVSAARVGAVPLITASDMKAAVTVRECLGQGGYAIGLYRALASHDFEALPPVGRAVLPRLLARRWRAGSYDYQAMCWYLTDQRNEGRGKPHIKNYMLYIDQMREVIRSIVGDDILGAERAA